MQGFTPLLVLIRYRFPLRYVTITSKGGVHMGNTKILNPNPALERAIELAKINIQSTPEWTNPEDVVKFIEVIYDALSVGKN